MSFDSGTRNLFYNKRRRSRHFRSEDSIGRDKILQQRTGFEALIETVALQYLLGVDQIKPSQVHHIKWPMAVRFHDLVVLQHDPLGITRGGIKQEPRINQKGWSLLELSPETFGVAYSSG